MEKAEVGMKGKTRTVLSLATMLVVVVAAYRWWVSSRDDLFVVEVPAHETLSEPDSIEPVPIAEPEPVSSRSPASGPDEEPPPSESPDSAPLTGSLSVELVFGDGSPAHGISVSVELLRPTSLERVGSSKRKSNATQRRASDLEGRAVFSELWPGGYFLTIDRSPTDARLVEITAGETEVLTLRLEGRDLEVTVVDAREVPIEGAAVLLLSPPSFPAVEVGRTDVRGTLTVQAVSECSVGAIRAGYSPSHFYLFAENSPQTMLIRLDAPGGALEGCVFGPDGAEVSDARVTVDAREPEQDTASRTDGFNTSPMNDWHAVADSRGCFVLDLRPGDMGVSVRTDDHAPWSGSCVIVAGSVTRLDVHLTGAAQCWGTVRSLSGEPSSGTWVDARFGEDSIADIARTNDDGAFALGHIPTGEFVLSARAEDGSSARAVLSARAGDSVHQDLDLADIQVLRGRVVDSKGEGLSDITITASSVARVRVPGVRGNKSDWVRSASTDETGAFAITEVPEQGVVYLIVQKNGAELARQEWQLPITSPVVVTIDRMSLGAIRGRIVDAAGTIIGHASIAPRFGGSLMARDHTTEMGSGVFAIGDLAEGSYTVVVQATGFKTLSTDVYVRGDETTDLGDLVMTRRQ